MAPRRFQLTTDGWQIYSGYDGAVRAVFSEDLNYATETKYFARPAEFLPRQLTSVRRKRKTGNPDMMFATTCHAERTNLSVRTFTRRFTRCTIGYSKTLENHKHAVALFIWHFNFCRVHSAHGYTPAGMWFGFKAFHHFRPFALSTLKYTMTIFFKIIVD